MLPITARDEPWPFLHLWRQHFWPKLASSILNFCRRKRFFQWCLDQSDCIMGPEICTKMLKKSEKLIKLIYGTKLEVVPSVKLLGLEMDSGLSFNSHVEKLCTKLSQQIGILKKIRSFLPMRQRLLFYNSMIRSVLHYVSSIWTSCDKENLGRVLKLQKRAARGNFWCWQSGVYCQAVQ